MELALYIYDYSPTIIELSNYINTIKHKKDCYNDFEETKIGTIKENEYQLMIFLPTSAFLINDSNTRNLMTSYTSQWLHCFAN